MDPQQLFRLTTQGVAEIFPGGADALAERLQKARASGQTLRVKLGVDPTRPDLHLGHTVCLRKLRQFQDAGHTAILLIGDFTAQIGDPTGKSEARPRLTPEEVEYNARTYLEQARLVLDFDTPGRLELRRNSEWLTGMNLNEIIGLLSAMSVAQMLAKEDFGERYTKGTPIYLHEFLYPLMQGYDSVALDADIELGGVDQKFNLLVGRDLQGRFKQKQQLGLVVPLLVGLDGVKKMSKSLDNYVGLTEDPLTMYSKLEKTPDALVENYFELLSELPISGLPTSARERQKLLALTVTGQFHSVEIAKQAQLDAINLTSEKGQGSDQVPVFAFTALAFPLPLAQLLKEAGLVESSSEGRRQIQNGGVRLNGQKLTDPKHTFVGLDELEGAVLQVGKKQFRRLVT